MLGLEPKSYNPIQSKSEDGLGYSVVLENEIYESKLPDSASIYTAEMTAIVQALEILHKPKEKFFIYSDSKSIIDSLEKFNTMHPLFRKAQVWLFWIAIRKKVVCFDWVPLLMWESEETKRLISVPEKLLGIAHIK